MTRFIYLVLTPILLLGSPAGFAGAENAHEEVLQVVEDMNAAWSDQDSSRCLTYFSADTDFENSFGWSVQGRDKLGGFLDWLFARYPKQDSGDDDNNRTASTAEFLTPNLALVESAQTVVSPTGDAPARTFRTTHLIKQENDVWLIWKTRIWEARASSIMPEQVAAPSRFPEMIDLMQY